MRAACWLLLGALLGLGPAACGGDGARVELAGQTMGTRWAVTLLAPPAGPAWRSEIEQVLARIDAEMSTWREDSELSRFNASPGDAWFPVSAETARVALEALAVHRRTDGAFDPTLGPLVELWGFAARQPRRVPPDAAALERARVRTGARALGVRLDPPALRKHVAELELDLSAIAKGSGVDAVAERLAALGARRFLVEIGGELRCAGAGPRDGAWHVAIERPQGGAAGPPQAGSRGWQRVLALRDAAVATSGTYRNFWEAGGERFSHLLDPRSGAPVRHDLVSASVVAATASLADAFATGLLVLGPEAGPRVAEREGLAAFFVAERGGRLVESHSPAFAPYLATRPEVAP